MNQPELRTIIVDDEAPAREVMQELLLKHPNIRVVGEANSVANAALLCRNLRPNLIFLDVQLRDGEGFDLLPKLDPVPAIIFVTAYDEFAVRAFEVNAVDYLIKPVDPARLAHALQRIVHRPLPSFNGKLLDDDRIYLESSSSLRMVYVTEVAAIKAQENYTIIHLRDGAEPMVRRTMAEWEAALPEEHFFRPHRSLIVNLREIKKISMNWRKELDLTITGFAEPIHLGWRAAARLRQVFRHPNLP